MKKDKKELFAKAVRDQMENENIASLPEPMDSQNDNQSNNDSNDKTKENKIEKDLSGDESLLDYDSAQGEKGKMEKEENSNIEKKESQEVSLKEVKYKNGSFWRSGIIILFFILGLGLGAWFWLSKPEVIPPRIYLSTSPISESSLAALPLGVQTLPQGKSIYIYFTNNGPLGVPRVFIRVHEIIPKSTQKEEKQVLIATHEASVDPRYKRLYTLFQSDYFDKSGKYEIQLADPAGKVMARRRFIIRGSKN